MSAAAAALVRGPTGAVPFAQWMRALQAHFEQRAAERLPGVATEPTRLHAAMRYAVLDGGKRIRPLLVYAAGEAADANRDALDHLALAVEYVHAYSLVHDDLPCMDNDVLRRGKPTVHVAYGEATAMLAGDALQAEAFRLLGEAPLPADVRLDVVLELARAAGTEGMCGGQAMDLDALERNLDASALERMHRMKTGALLRASVLLGARAGNLAPEALIALDRYGAAIGLAFQVIDDILDVESTSEEMGKTPGKDEAQHKATYVSVLGLAAAKARAAQLRDAADEALDAPSLDRLPTERLRELAGVIVARRG